MDTDLRRATDPTHDHGRTRALAAPLLLGLALVVGAPAAAGAAPRPPPSTPPPRGPRPATPPPRQRKGPRSRSGRRGAGRPPDRLERRTGRELPERRSPCRGG